MNILAIDTATETLGLCLRSETDTRTVSIRAGLKHSEGLMPAVRQLLADGHLECAQLDLIVCSTGPGSFTGVRIGLATAKGLAFGVQNTSGACALIGASTLDGLARRYSGYSETVVAVNPSLRKNHYAAIFQRGRRCGEYLELPLGDLAEALDPYPSLLITGAAAAALHEMLLQKRSPEQLVLDSSLQNTDPPGLLECGLSRFEACKERGEEPEEPVPLYLRKSEAEIRFFGV